MGEVVMKAGLTTGKKIILVVILGLIALVGVFLALVFLLPRVDYTAARDKITGIIDTKAPIEKFLAAETDSLEFSDENKSVIADFEGALEKSKSLMDELEASNALKDTAVAEKFAIAKEQYGNIAKLATAWSEVKMLSDLTDEKLETLKKSENKMIRNLAEDLGKYRADVQSFKQNYSENAKKSSDIIEAYGNLQLQGNALNKKYEDISLKDVVGMSSDDILVFYATIEELNKICQK